MYAAHKPMEVDLQGIHLGETQVEVYNQTRLRSVKTDFDGIPLFGQLVNGVARSQHEQKQPELSREVKEKVAARAKERIDAEAGERLGRTAALLQDKVFAPLDALCLDPTMIAAQTTEERVIARLRLAGRDQLGSYTPRPLAPADSLASVQIDQSVINNVVERLDLDGRTFTLPELSRHVARCLCRPEPTRDQPGPRGRCDQLCRQGRGAGALRRRASGSDRLDRPIRQGHARLERLPSAGVLSSRGRAGGPPNWSATGSCNSIGPRLNTGAQIILRGVFSRAFSKKTPGAHAPAAGDRSEAGRPGDYAVRDRRRLDRRGPGPAADGAAGRL